MKKVVKITIVLTMCFAQITKAQDFHLSLYDSGPLFLNPALTGIVDSKYRIHGQYRNQWSSVAFKPFTTALISADMPKGKWGFGGQIINMRAGIGNYNVFQALASASYYVPIDKNKYHNLSFGLQGGVTQKSVEYKLYSFDSQYTNKDGGYFDKNAPTNETFTRQSQMLHQLNAGILYFYAKQQSRLNPFFGISGFNLTRPRETFFDQPNHLPVRLNIHTGTRINLNELVYVLPKILIMKQGKATEQTYAIDGGYYFKHDKFFLLAGYVFRSGDASIANVGFKKENYIFKIAYDFNTSSLRTATKTRGALELSFTYLPGREKVNDIRNCPRL